MKRTRVALPGRDLEELRRTAFRLGVYSEEWNTLDRDGTEAELARAMEKLSPQELQMKLGLQRIQEMRRLSIVWKKKDGYYAVDHVSGFFQGLAALYQLIGMGLAVRTEEEFRVDPLALQVLEPLSEETEEEIGRVDEMQEAVDELLDRWGMVNLDTMMDVLTAQDEDLDPEFLEGGILSAMLERHGQSSVKEWEGMMLLLDERVMNDPAFMENLESALYRKLPYRYGTDSRDRQEEIISLVTGEAAYPLYVLLTPGKELPQDPSDVQGSLNAAVRKRIRHSKKAHALCVRLSQAAMQILVGRRSEAEEQLMALGRKLKTPAERREYRGLVREFLEDCPQWALKGWTIAEVRAAQRVSDRQYLSVLDLMEPLPGEDDLCPCGSGKLFRKCHGTGN